MPRTLLLLLSIMSTAAFAQTPALQLAPVQSPAVQTPAEALAQDAGQYVLHHPVPLDEAIRRLRAQQDSIVATDGIQREFAGRLAGMSLEHDPPYRIVVLLTGPEAVAERSIAAGGMAVPVIFRTGAEATRAQIVLAMRQHQAELRAAFPAARGMGLDQRTGELVLMLDPGDIAAGSATKQQAEAITGVPVRLQLADGPDGNMVVAGGGRIDGGFAGDGRRFVCTSGFVVTDGARTGLATAAHCADAVTYHDPDGADVALDFAGQWGARVQDIQINLSPRTLQPLFYADRRQAALRSVTSWRNRGSLRAGDSVCHWGESSGYSCAEVALTDFAPPRDLCGGACEPVWVTVHGPDCHGGDSGGPVFSGTIAVGIVKGGNRTRGGRCNFYYFMSIDYLPAGWTLLHN